MSKFSVRDFLDLEAIIALEDDEDEEENDSADDILDDDEISNDGADGPGAISHAGLSSSMAERLERQARGIEARAGYNRDARSLLAANGDGDAALPLRVPLETDSGIWSVRVKLGQEADVVFQICRRCLEPSEIHPPAIMSAFTRPSIPGYVFIEALHVGEVRHAVDGLVTVRDKQPRLIMVTEYVSLLSCLPQPSIRIEGGQWVRCLAGRYRNDIGYVFKSDQPDATVVFVPRISQPRGKRQRDGRPPPRAWTAAEVIEQYGKKRVAILGPNKFVFRRGVYEDGLVMERVPLSYLRTLDHSPEDIAPFVQSSMLRSHLHFNPCLKQFAQESTQVGDRVLVVLGECAGIIGCAEKIHNGVADVITQSPEEHSGLVVSVALRELMPHFLAGDHVKDRWSDRVGIVVAVDQDSQKVTFLAKDSASCGEIDTSTHNLQFYSPTSRFFRFTPGLFVEFPGEGGATRRGRILQASDSSVQVVDERNGGVLYVDENDLTVSSVQATTLPQPTHRRVWEGQRVVVTGGPFKGYHGLVRVEDVDAVDVELDARLAASGGTRQRFSVEQVRLFVERPAPEVLNSPSHTSRTPPPEGLAPPMARALTPEPEKPEQGPWSTDRRPAWTHWLFAKELQEAVGERCIPFHIRGLPALSPHAKFEGHTAKTVPATRQKIQPEPNDVVVSVVERGRVSQISVSPSYLVPWTPKEGGNVVTVGDHRIGQVGKLVKLDDGCCAVELAPSGETSYFLEGDVVNVLLK